MGCDIHAHINYMEEDIPNVYQFAQVKIDRDYDLFSVMAGVRNYDGRKPVSMPKGLPEKISYQTQEDADGWKADGHSYSWLSYEEVCQVQEQIPNNYEGQIYRRPSWEAVITAMKTLEECGLKTMLVFWFDN